MTSSRIQRQRLRATETTLVSTYSTTTSAAYDHPEADRETHLLPVQWDLVAKDEFNRGLCSFTTSSSVRSPREGEPCLGMPSGKRRRGKHNVSLDLS